MVGQKRFSRDALEVASTLMHLTKRSVNVTQQTALIPRTLCWRVSAHFNGTRLPAVPSSLPPRPSKARAAPTPWRR